MSGPRLRSLTGAGWVLGALRRACRLGGSLLLKDDISDRQETDELLHSSKMKIVDDGATSQNLVVEVIQKTICCALKNDVVYFC